MEGVAGNVEWLKRTYLKHFPVELAYVDTGYDFAIGSSHHGKDDLLWISFHRGSAKYATPVNLRQSLDGLRAEMRSYGF